MFLVHQTSQVVCTHSKRPSENTESLAEVAEDLGGELEEAVKQPFIHEAWVNALANIEKYSRTWTA